MKYGNIWTTVEPSGRLINLIINPIPNQCACHYSTKFTTGLLRNVEWLQGEREQERGWKRPFSAHLPTQMLHDHQLISTKRLSFGIQMCSHYEVQIFTQRDTRLRFRTIGDRPVYSGFHANWEIRLSVLVREHSINTEGCAMSVQSSLLGTRSPLEWKVDRGKY